MSDPNFKSSILLDQTPKEVFDAINNVRSLDLPRFGGRVVESIYSGMLMLLLRWTLGFSVPGFLSRGTSNAVCRVSGRSFAVC